MPEYHPYTLCVKMKTYWIAVEVIVHKQETKVKTYNFIKGPGHMSLLKAK